MLHTFFSVLAPTCYLSVTISSLLPVTLYLPPIQYDLLSGPRMYLILSHVLAFKHPIPPPGMLSSPLTGHHLRRGVSLNPQTRGGLPSLQWAPALLWCVCVCVSSPDSELREGGGLPSSPCWVGSPARGPAWPVVCKRALNWACWLQLKQRWVTVWGPSHFQPLWLEPQN